MHSINRLLFGAMVAAALPAMGQQGVPRTQVPPSIAAETQGIQDRFAAVLEEECPSNVCTPVGCETTRFLTLDERQGSSLPGLDFNEEPVKYLQYKLASVRCEFTYEPGMDEKRLANLRQRLLQKVKVAGVAVQLNSRKLEPKPDVSNATDEKEKLPPPPAPPPPSIGEQFAAALIPVSPWILCGLVGLLVLMTLIWSLRRLGRPRPVAAPSTDALAVVAPSDAPALEAANAKASPYMVLTKTEQLRHALTDAPQIADQMLRPLLDAENYAELCLFLHHFGPDFLQSFRKKVQFQAKLTKLSESYDKEPPQASVADVWDFLERTERRLVATKVRLEHEPLEDEFAFMSNLGVDEVKGLLAEVSTTEAICAIANMPRHLRDEFFAASDAHFITAFVEQLATVDKLPDSFVRQTAHKLRAIQETMGGDLRTVPLKRVPLLEQALNALGPKDRKDLWSGIAKSRPELIEAVSPRIFLDAALKFVPDDFLTEAFLTLSPRAAAAYLDGIEEKKDILGRMKPRLAESISRYLNSAKPDKLLAGEARAQIAAYVKEKDAQGAIDLAKINAQVVK